MFASSNNTILCKRRRYTENSIGVCSSLFNPIDIIKNESNVRLSRRAIPKSDRYM